MRSFRIMGRTDVGLVRSGNEDHILVARFVKNRGKVLLHVDGDDDFLIGRGLLLAVADGIGGQAGGQYASRIALATLDRIYYQNGGERMDRQSAADALKVAIRQANAAILDQAASDPELNHMGTTLSGVCLLGDGLLVFNAGDSRVYRWRNGLLKAVTEDDTVVAQAVRSGYMSIEQARQSGYGHMITNCLGARDYKLRVEEGPELQAGDLLLISSDGLHDMMPHERLEKILSEQKNLEQMMAELFLAAIGAGGRDNISAILLRVEV